MSTATRIDTSDMLLIHRVLRREIGALPALIRGARDPGRAKVVGEHAREMLQFLHHHHTGEDELLWPVLRPRVDLEGALLDRMEGQHEEIAGGVAAVERDLAGWTRTADPAAGERMAAELEAMHAVLVAHLQEEEERILPLVAVHFTQQQWDALGKHGLAAIPGRRRLPILGHILEETDEAERARFLRRIPPPARLAYRLVGRRLHAREVLAVRGSAT
jgi:hemerythrin-like domain-containing protein